VFAVAGTAIGAEPGPGPKQDQARRILEATGVEGGLVVHLGCGDGKLTAALRAADRYLVDGLDTDAANVAKAREYLRSQGLYGSVSARQFDGRHLPYAESIVNLLVAEELGDVAADVAADEVLRVLVPGGVAYVKAGRQWTKTVKPWPAEIDQWTHFLHDASNNAVAKDLQVGPPRRLRWVCGPLWSRSHEFNSSLCAMVSAGGRLFYMFDEGLTGVTAEPIPEKWMLIARDGFNGVLLWKRPVPNWGTGPWRSTALRNIPPTVPRRLVAQHDRVFVTLGHNAPVSVLDAATGKVLATYAETEGTEEFRCLDGVLVLRKGADSLLAIDTKTGKRLWEATGNVRPISLAARGGKVFYQAGQIVLCVGLRDGQELWQAPSKSPVSLLVACDDCVVLLSRQALQAVSVDTGETLWSVKAGVARGELFAANNQLWHWEGGHIVGRDLRSGEVTTRLNTDDVFTPGHHLRCYQSKATERFLITPNRGVEFVSLTGAPHTQNDWVRGACRYGIMPSGGLLYVPPNPCFCYPGVKLTGFNALAPKGDEGRGNRGERQETGGKKAEALRLERGPAYNRANHQSSIINHHSEDWPTYRHDSRRSGGTGASVPANLKPSWEIKLGGHLTQPVVADGRVFVASKDTHSMHVLDEESGTELWQYTAGSRIDSPPTVYGELVLFGCADGFVYCLRAQDGELVWRFRAAPTAQLIVAFGQLESPWRVHGSVLVERGIAYVTAGRSTYLDSGILVFGLDPNTGKVLHETLFDSWSRTRKDAENKPFIPAYHMEGAFSDILVSEGGHIYLGQYKLDCSLKQQDVPYALFDPQKQSGAMGLEELMDKPYIQEMETQIKDERVQRNWQLRQWPEMARKHKEEYGASNLGERTMGRHVFATGGFLDDAWYNRTFWMYSETWPGFYIANRGAKTGQLLSVDGERTYAVQAFPRRNLQSPLFTPGQNGYLLCADDNDNEPVIPDYTRGVPKGIGFTRKNPPAWFKWIPVRIRAMVVTQNALFVAGPPDILDPQDPMAAFEGRKGGLLWAVAAKDGAKLAQCKLESPPVFDGMIAAGGKLFISSKNGTVLCMGGR
jgi:outer membrane protein assembly factor BamB